MPPFQSDDRIDYKQSPLVEGHFRNQLRSSTPPRGRRKEWSHAQHIVREKDMHKVSGDTKVVGKPKAEQRFQAGLRDWPDAKDVGAEFATRKQEEAAIAAGATKASQEIQALGSHVTRLYRPSAKDRKRYEEELRTYDWDKDMAHISPTKQRPITFYRQGDPKADTLTPAMANKTFHGMLRQPRGPPAHMPDWDPTPKGPEMRRGHKGIS